MESSSEFSTESITGERWSSRTSETGRVFLTATVTDNTFEFDSSFLSTLGGLHTSRTGTTPPRIRLHRPSRSAADSARKRPGRTAAPRFPWTVGNALTVNGSDQPIFVDPIENVVTVQSNSVETIATNGTVTPESGLSGQVYAGIVNGVTDAPTLTPETYNNQPYYPFNLDNLNVSTTPAPTPTPTPRQRRHQLHADPVTHSDTHAHAASTPTPTAVASGSDSVSAGLAGLNQIVVSWSSSPGASSYIVERSLDGSTWSTIAAGVTATSFADSGLNYSTIYYYRVLAVSSAGTSPASVMVSATTTGSA